jgi:hypothetical protein
MMDKRTARVRAVAFGILSLAWVAAGCGGSSPGTGAGEGGVPSSCKAASPSLGTMSWLDDGLSTCATNAIATFTTSAQLSLFSLTASTPSVGITLSVESAEGPATIGGTYQCGTTDGGIIPGSPTQRGPRCSGCRRTARSS